MKSTIESLWTEDRRQLWARIQAHPFESDSGLDFARRLAREHGWSRAEAVAAIEEYRRFCFLALAAGHEVTPSDAVDEVWHLHLTYSRDYWELYCAQALRAPLHHQPTTGRRDEDARYREQYAQTLASYEAWFGSPSPSLWPGTQQRFRDAARYRRVDLQQVMVLRRWRWPRLSVRFASVLVVLALLATTVARAADINPLNLAGADFLILFLQLLAIASIAAVFARWYLRAGTQASTALPTDTYEIAYLVGGAGRLLDAGVTELMARGAVRWDPEQRKLVAEADAHGLHGPLEALHKHLRVEGRPAQAASRLHAALSPLRRALVARGLLLDDAAASKARWLPALLPGALLALGVAKIVVGISRDKPVGYLVALCVVAAIVAAIFAFKRAERTRAGDAAVVRIRQQHSRAARAPLQSELPLAVALVGTSMLAGTAYASYHTARVPQGGDSSSSGSSCSSGSSDSGGGDGGGSSGCGGCGGGGGD